LRFISSASILAIKPRVVSDVKLDGCRDIGQRGPLYVEVELVIRHGQQRPVGKIASDGQPMLWSLSRQRTRNTG